MTDENGDSPDAIARKRAETLAAILATVEAIMASLRNIEATLDRMLARFREPPETGP